MIGLDVSDDWAGEMAGQFQRLRQWLADPANIDDVLEGIADTLVEKHHDYGEENLAAFGELGILVRASDKLARLKNLVDKPGAVKDERREDTWRDLAGYAVQALIMMKRAGLPPVDLFALRRERLVRGLCPDCGDGVILRRQQWGGLPVSLYCSEHCGFTAQVDLFDLEAGGTSEVIHRLAGRAAVEEQTL